MITFTVHGFITEGGKRLNFIRDIFADSPADATEKALRLHANLVVSCVLRANTGIMDCY
jgi:hypothetical protein